MSSGTGRITKIEDYLDLQNTANVKGFTPTEKTADYTVLEGDSGAIFVANHATTVVNFTLPTSFTDLENRFWIFANIGAAGMGIIGNANIVCFNNAGASSVSFITPNAIVGSSCLVVGDGTLYYFFDTGKTTKTIA